MADLVYLGEDGSLVSGDTGIATADNQVNGDQITNERSKLDLIPYAEQLSASDQIVPSAGKAIEVVWCQVIGDPDASNGNLVTIGFDSGVTLYKVYSLGRSAIFRGDPDQALNITLENSENVTVNIHYREV